MMTPPKLRRVQVRWLLGSIGLAAGLVVTVWSMRLMTGEPGGQPFWTLGCLALIPVLTLVSFRLRDERAAGWFVTRALGLAAALVVVMASYVVLVIGINGKPGEAARPMLLWSLAAAVVAVVLGPMVAARVMRAVQERLHADLPTTGEAVSAFGARMSRAVPMDELLLQLAESLREAVPGSRSEIWTGTAALLTRTVSVPTLPAAALTFGATEETTIARARIGGPAWARVWIPALVPEDGWGDFRVVPVAHLGELLGLVCVYRPTETAEFDDADEAALVELAHQLGLALHNVRLDSALQASLDELAERNRELQASRLRIVNAADTSRREIERNLHDGAQQHLVALAVKIGIARQIAGEDNEGLTGLLDGLREDVQVTIQQLRELAHGIYPPLLRDRGLGDALKAAATRSPLPCDIAVDLPGRYPQEVETAAYFCTLEAMQNAGKHAGPGATITVTAAGDASTLSVTIRDDGVGFDPEQVRLSHGFVNMQDRLGALGGTLQVDSAVGAGTTITASIPAQPLTSEGSEGDHAA